MTGYDRNLARFPLGLKSIDRIRLFKVHFQRCLFVLGFLDDPDPTCMLFQEGAEEESQVSLQIIKLCQRKSQHFILQYWPSCAILHLKHSKICLLCTFVTTAVTRGLSEAMSILN